MPVVDVVNLDGKKVGQVELADAIFGAKVNQHLLHEASRWYLRGLRRGTHKVKEKSEVSGAGRKRSEEHTSELQSRLHLVCRLLLEKKKKNKLRLFRQKKKNNQQTITT